MLEETVEFKFRNVNLSWREFQEGKTVLQAMPSRSFIELTKNCNFSCIMCKHSFDPSFEKYRPEFNMPIELFTRVAEELFPYMTFVDFRGYGETTVLPYWPEVVDYVSKFSGIQWHLNTNLSLPIPEVWKRMIANNFVIAFSCDGATKATLETIRKGANYEKIMLNLASISEAIKTYKKGAIYFLTTIQALNIVEVPEIIRLAHLYDVGCVALRIVRWDENLAPPTEKIFGLPLTVLGEIFRETVALAREYKIHVDVNDAELNSLAEHWPNPKNFHNPHWHAQEAFEYEPFRSESYAVAKHQRCFKPFGYVFIYHDGTVGPCNHLSYPAVRLGNLYEQSFKEIWNRPSFQNFRKQLLTARPQHPDCKWCFAHRMTD